MRTKKALAILLAIGLAMTAAKAQIAPTICFGDDGFNSGCCQPVTPNLPVFPSFTTAGTYGCIHNCALEAQHSVLVSIAAPNMVLCDYARISITVTPSSPGAPGFTTLQYAKYARTWIEQAPNGVLRQVWRFLLNGDWNYTPSLSTAAACPIPPCTVGPNGVPAHATGSIDYALDCLTPTPAPVWSIALNLTHILGCISHAPFSQRPLAGLAAHVDRSYALVAPANFLFGPAAEPQGPITDEDTRSSVLNPTSGTYTCLGEATVHQGQLSTQFSDCFSCAPIQPVVGNWKHQSLSGFASCGAITVIFPFTSVPMLVFPTGLAGLTLGTYVGINPNQFPVGRSITVYFGVIDYLEPCSATDPAAPIHAVSGVGVTQGDPMFLFSPSTAAAGRHQSLDLGNMLIMPTFQRGFGAPFFTTLLWNLNMP
jgi:hypothetical protein